MTFACRYPGCTRPVQTEHEACDTCWSSDWWAMEAIYGWEDPNDPTWPGGWPE